MTNVVIGQTGLIGNSIYLKLKNKINFVPRNWEYTTLIKNLMELKIKDALNIYWAAGQNNNNSNQLQINQEVELINNFLNKLNDTAVKINQINYISSAGSIYAGNNEKFINEDSPPSPVSIYGSSRLLIEDMFENYCKANDIYLNIFRLSNVFGFRQRQKPSSGLINNLIMSNLNRIPLNIFVPLFVKQDYIDTNFVSSNIIGIAKVTKKNTKLKNTYILSRNQSHSIQDLLILIDRILIKKTPFVMQPDKNAKVRKANLIFNTHSNTLLRQKIEPIEFTIKKLILELIRAKVA